MDNKKQGVYAVKQQGVNAEGDVRTDERAAVATTNQGVNQPDCDVVRCLGSVAQSGTLNPQTTFGAWTRAQELLVCKTEAEEGYFSIS